MDLPVVVRNVIQYEMLVNYIERCDSAKICSLVLVRLFFYCCCCCQPSLSVAFSRWLPMRWKKLENKAVLCNIIENSANELSQCIVYYNVDGFRKCK